MSSSYRQAREAEERGDLESAAKLYATAGFEKIREAAFEPDVTGRVGVATLVRSISCHSRAGDDRRTEGMGRVAESVLSYFRSAADDDCLLGLLHEWSGDIHLLTGSSAAVEEYETAADIYQHCSDSEQLSWGMEQEFDYALWAVEAYLDSSDRSVEGRLPETDFDSRIRSKLDIAEQYVESE